MKKSTIRVLIIFVSLSLLGVLLTQLYWIRKAILVSEAQYDSKASFALNEVRREMGKRDNYSSDSGICTIFTYMDTLCLRQLMVKYFDFYGLDDDFECALKFTPADSLLWCSPGFITRRNENTSVVKKCFADITGTVESHMEVFFPAKRKYILVKMSLWLSVATGLFIITIFCFTYIVFAIIKQKKLADIKNDFVNNMTHEFKTPLSTISLASEVLMQSDVKTSRERLKKYSKIIYDENQRMRLQVDRILQMAIFDKGDFTLKKAKSDIHSLLRITIHNLCLERCSKPVSVDFNFKAENSFAFIDIMHFINVITNLVDNAVKYSGDQTAIFISTHNSDHGIHISVKDNGIGMGQDAMKHIFEKFYRVPTGNLHNVKGFGLGLYYVRKIIEAHTGYITVESTLHQGSCFDIYIPFGEEE